MNATVSLAYIASFAPMTRFNELDRVRLLRSVKDMDGKVVGAGASGTVVAVWGDGDAYEVEFVDPIQALATVKAEDLEVGSARA